MTIVWGHSALTAHDNSIAARLRGLRLQRGYAKARHFAQVLGISENRYTRYERGEAEPDVELMRLICEKLGATPNELFGWTEDGGEPNDRVPTGAGTGRPSSQPVAAAPGFGEAEPHRVGLGWSGVMAAAAVAGLPGGMAPTEIAAWRLASEFGRAGLGATATTSGEGNLGALQVTAELFLKLRKEPLAVVAQILRSAELAALEADAQARLSLEIERFLVAIGAAPDK